ncbi:2-dehydro-3-deoxygluconokinase [Cohnella kolymensis]|uniref:2-dehydro-3-deoxygluconokinase n=1 Tax=Cohnella kolymensis TaxID=1590652 RepID=A0ABR4ZZX4_9BACL|nr:sugar kinase [Cohnella kolymensis]KIL34369.1 2-dehydro-3-deoxygluconokinase [Cohnella kolymensis]
MDILAIGEPMMEFSEIRDPHRGNIYLPGLGGDTSNFAVAASRQGAKVGYFTRLGQDVFGDRFMELWQHEGIDTKLVIRDPKAPTGIYFVTHTDQGHQFTYYRKGSAASLLNAYEISESMIKGTKLLHVSGISQAISESSCDAINRAIHIARSNGVMVSYDANLRLKLWPLAQAKAVIENSAVLSDVFMPSYEDAEQLTGLQDEDQIVDHYLQMGVKRIALKLGKRGVLVATFDERHRIDGFQVNSVDATGAGDTFDGAFLSQMLKGVSMPEAARYANAAAAISTTGYGAVAPIPDQETVEAFLMKQQ